MINFLPSLLGLDVERWMGDEALIKCPYHNDTRPSATFNANKGLFYCFTCQITKTAKQLAFDAGIDFEPCENTQEIEYVKKILHGKELDSWAPILGWPLAIDHPYLKSRKVPNKLVKRFEIRGTRTQIAFPQKDVLGNITGFQTRNTKNKLYKWFGKRQPLWPIDIFVETPIDDSLYLVEGVFGALRGISANVPTVSINGAGATKSILFASSRFNLMTVFDDDPAGWKASARGLAMGMPFCKVKDIEPDELSVEKWKRLTSTRLPFFSTSLGILLSRGGSRYYDETLQAFRKMRGRK